MLRSLQRQAAGTQVPSQHSPSSRTGTFSCVAAPLSPGPAGTSGHPAHCSSHSSHGSTTFVPVRPLVPAPGSHVGSVSSIGGSFGRSSGGPLLEQFKCGTLQVA
jgi:hypothetical protein